MNFLLNGKQIKIPPGKVIFEQFTGNRLSIVRIQHHLPQGRFVFSVQKTKMQMLILNGRIELYGCDLDLVSRSNNAPSAGISRHVRSPYSLFIALRTNNSFTAGKDSAHRTYRAVANRAEIHAVVMIPLGAKFTLIITAFQPPGLFLFLWNNVFLIHDSYPYFLRFPPNQALFFFARMQRNDLILQPHFDGARPIVILKKNLVAGDRNIDRASAVFDVEFKRLEL